MYRKVSLLYRKAILIYIEVFITIFAHAVLLSKYIDYCTWNYFIRFNHNDQLVKKNKKKYIINCRDFDLYIIKYHIFSNKTILNALYILLILNENLNHKIFINKLNIINYFIFHNFIRKVLIL